MLENMLGDPHAKAKCDQVQYSELRLCIGFVSLQFRFRQDSFHGERSDAILRIEIVDKIRFAGISVSPGFVSLGCHFGAVLINSDQMPIELGSHLPCLAKGFPRTHKHTNSQAGSAEAPSILNYSYTYIYIYICIYTYTYTYIHIYI